MKAKSKRMSIYVLTGMLNLTLLTGCQSSEIANQTPPVQEDTYIPSKTASAQLGQFSTQDIYGNIYTQDIFKDYDLTLVNVFTTWCTPCVEEIPDLEKLYQDMSDRGVQVVGVLLDVLNEKGEIQQDMLEKSQLLATKAGATYPFLLPDTTYMNGHLIGVESFPETFFVDKNGNVVGQTYSGSHGYEDWKTIVEQELARLEED